MIADWQFVTLATAKIYENANRPVVLCSCDGSKLVVTQTGICGFGHNVSAEGTYKKVSSKKPKFGSD